jgi:hypothetical protein
MRRIKSKEVRRLVKLFVAAGCEVSFSASSHVIIRKGGKVVTVVPSTPSDHRSLSNSVAQARRNGVKI